MRQNQIFWKTIKPYLSKKNTSGPSKVILTENSKLITKQNEVSEILNSFFTNVANDIGKGVSFDEENHPNICKIKENMNPELSFNFSETEEHNVGKIIDKLQVKKATGVDKISCKILKLAKTALQSPLTGLRNLSVRTSTFPDSIKRAQVTPPS